MQFMNGYYKEFVMGNGVGFTDWVQYPAPVRFFKWVCLVVAVGIVFTFFGSFVPAYEVYGWMGVWYSVTNWINLIFVPPLALCVWVVLKKAE